MYIRVNEGAVVKFLLLGSAEPVSIFGKVIHVFPDEVEICQQKTVYRNQRLDTSISADYSETLHIARHLIQSWAYAKVSDFSHIAKSISEGRSFNFMADHEPSFSEHNFNHYGEDGFCRGNGPYCGDIKLDSSTIIITIPQKNNCDGMGMGLEP